MNVASPIGAGNAEMDAVAGEPGRLVGGVRVPVEDLQRAVPLSRSGQLAVVAAVEVPGRDTAGQHVRGVGAVGQPQHPLHALRFGFGHHASTALVIDASS